MHNAVTLILSAFTAIAFSSLTHGQILNTTEELPFAERNTPLVKPASQEEIPLGYEAVTGVRSEYIYRGRRLADSVFDFQVHGYFSYDADQHLEYGAWHAAETGSGSFQESGLMIHYVEDRDHWSFGIGIRYRDLSGSTFKSGFELNSNVSYHFNSNQIISTELSFDTGANGWYGKIQYDHYTKIDADSYISFRAGVSLSSGYYEAQAFNNQVENGFNDAFAKLTYTYNITKQISISPFIGTSIQKNDATLYGGLWFETSF